MEPKTIEFNLRVHGIGGTRTQTFPSTIKIQGCDNEKNDITNPGERAWRYTVLNDRPTRRNTNIGIGGFTYSNAYCKFLKYSIVGEDASLLSVSGSTFTYQTNLLEPRTLKYSLRVHAQGDGINGHTHIQDFPSTLKIQGCDNEANTITNPSFTAFKQTVLKR